MFQRKARVDTFDTSDFKAGDIVEFLREGEWILGEIEESTFDGRILVWPMVGNNYCVLGECKLRQTSETIARATQFIEEKIKEKEDLINHVQEKKIISELKAKLRVLTPKDMEE